MCTKQMLKSIVRELNLHEKHEITLIDKGAMVYYSLNTHTDSLTFIVPKKSDLMDIAIEHGVTTEVINNILTVSFEYNGVDLKFINTEINLDKLCTWSSYLKIYVLSEEELYKELVDDEEKLVFINVLSTFIKSIESFKNKR